MSAPRPRRAYADGPFGQIHYQEYGAGTPVILLHQAPMTSGQFDNVYAPLARRGIRAIGIDMPGFGMSDATDWTPKVEDYARSVPSVLDALGIDRAVVLGHHTGALVATEVHLQFPARVSAVVMAGPMPLTQAERTDFMENGYHRERAFKARPGGAHLVELFNTRDKLANGTVTADRISDYVVQALMGHGEFWHGHHAAFQYRQEETLALVTCPTLILTNTGDLIYEHALRAQQARPDFAFFALEGGGVDIVDQQPEEWSEAVANFVKNQ